MRKWIKQLILLFLIASTSLLNPQQVQADTNLADGRLHEAEATAYAWSGNKTATGTIPADRRTVAFSPKYYGCCIAIWEYTDECASHQGDFLGYYIIEDTGSEPIENGEVIDIFIYSESECFEFGRKRVVFQIIEGGQG